MFFLVLRRFTQIEREEFVVFTFTKNDSFIADRL